MSIPRSALMHHDVAAYMLRLLTPSRVVGTPSAPSGLSKWIHVKKKAVKRPRTLSLSLSLSLCDEGESQNRPWAPCEASQLEKGSHW